MYFCPPLYMLSSWWFPDLWSEGYFGGKGQVKPQNLLLQIKIVNLKQYCILGRTAEIGFTIKNLKDLVVLSPSTYPFSSPLWTVSKIDGSWRMTVDNHKFNQVMTPIAAAVANVVWLFKQIDISLYRSCAAIDLAKIFSISVRIDTRKSLFSAGKARNTTYYPTSEVYNSLALFYICICIEFDCYSIPQGITLVHYTGDFMLTRLREQKVPANLDLVVKEKIKSMLVDVK